MNNTPTPRTDALIRAEFRTKAARFNSMRHHARTLERELTAAREEIAKYKSIAETAISDHELSEIRNHKLTEQRDSLWEASKSSEDDIRMHLDWAKRNGKTNSELIGIRKSIFEALQSLNQNAKPKCEKT